MTFGLRCLPPCTLSGAWQMAIDAWLLERIARGERSGPLLRFYRWSQPTLSLGKHQRAIEERWLRLARAGRLALVRRPTGGSAVLHGGDLTYALLWPDPPRQRREAYRLCCQWLREAFAVMDQPLNFGDAPARADQPNCFASSTAADLVHRGGVKRVGSAQLWRGRSLLQHGSVQLHPDEALWRAVFDEPAPALSPLPLASEALEAQLLDAALRGLPWAGRPPSGGLGEAASLIEEPLTPDEWQAIAATLSAYEVPGFPGAGTGGAASAASATALATDPRANPNG
ncbi:MAG: biotin/lipoate A/B protein ligase family protein [Cyanobacteriota bacterium]|nr:biotin/lipoate A/B protein ligase family protein [Cyanobacteriota bacterium]